MDKHLTLQQSMVLRGFGPTARIDGTLGTARAPGRLTITVADVPLGDGIDFAEAFEAATKRAAELSRRPTP